MTKLSFCQGLAALHYFTTCSHAVDIDGNEEFAFRELQTDCLLHLCAKAKEDVMPALFNCAPTA